MNRYQSSSRPLSEREMEILSNLAEEAAEVVQAVMKIIRFGPNDLNPREDLPAAVVLSKEIGNLKCMIRLALAEGLLYETAIEVGDRAKEARLKTFSRHLP